jgi:hypothetical protein
VARPSESRRATSSAVRSRRSILSTAISLVRPIIP